MTFLKLTSMKIAINLIINLLLFLIPYFFLGYNNIKATLSAAIIITRAPKWQNTTVKRISLTLPSDLTAHSLAQTVIQETQTNKLTSKNSIYIITSSLDSPVDF